MIKHPLTKDRFKTLVKELTHPYIADGPVYSLYNKLIAAYSERYRHYHNTSHLMECFNLFSEHKHLAENPNEVELAIWFHDVVYKRLSSTNEENSAKWMAIELKNAFIFPYPVGSFSRIWDLILATKIMYPPQTKDQMLIKDIDCAILGADLQSYRVYAELIKKEYWFYPFFKKKRLEFLNMLFKKDTIYYTKPFKDLYEDQARKNIITEIFSNIYS